MQHFLCFSFSFFTSSMCCVTFLPQEFGSTQEQTCTHFPAHYVCPLVAQDRQVTVWVDPVFISTPDNSFWSWTNNQFFFQFGSRVYNHTRTIFCILQTIVSYYRTFLSEAFYVFSFTAQIRFRNQQREIRIHMSCSLEHIVKDTLHFFPDGISVRLDYHTATHRRLFSQIGLYHQIIIPLWIVFTSLG